MGAHRSWTFPFRDIVLIADLLPPLCSDDVVYLRKDLEMTDGPTLSALLEALSQLGLKVHHYETPQILGERAHLHANDLVLSIYGGQGSRNRLALIPAICEAYGLQYVGTDVYGSVICHDKEVSKNLAHGSGLETPRHRIIRNERDADVIHLFSVPFVVKPLMEGSSIGIGQRNLVLDHDDGIAIALDLLRELRQPVLVEDFVRGREVSYNCIDADPAPHWSYSEIYVDDHPNYFDTHLFDAEEKCRRHLRRRVVTIDIELDPKDKASMHRLLRRIGRFGYCRIDGKHRDGKFVFLEITPDAWISPKGAFAGSFINKGWSYPQVIQAVLASAALNPRGR